MSVVCPLLDSTTMCSRRRSPIWIGLCTCLTSTSRGVVSSCTSPITMLIFNLSPTVYEGGSSPASFSAAPEDMIGFGASTSSSTTKRGLPTGAGTQNKRVCLPDPSTGRPAPYSSAPSPVQPPARPGVVARADSALVTLSSARFQNEVVRPIRQAFEHLRSRCVICLLVGDEDWETHRYDNCAGTIMKFGDDDPFTKFKKEFRYLRGCFGCGVWFCPSYICYSLTHFHVDRGGSCEEYIWENMPRRWIYG